MKKDYKKKLWIALAATAWLSVGCGANPQRATADGYDDPSGYGGYGMPGGGLGGNSGDIGTPPADPGTNTGVDPSISFSFGLNINRDGAGNPINSWTSPDITTDTLLRVKVRPGAAGPINIPGSGYVANYGCIRYSVTVSNQTITTPMLAVNGGSSVCKGAPTEVTLDFSSRLVPGHGPMKVTVSDASYDFYYSTCKANPWLYNASWYGCDLYYPVRPLYKNHTATGSVSIQVNGTSLD